MSHFNYIIVGQGFAGTTLAWQLLNRGENVRIIDNQLRHNSSIVSAGIINPITGLRLNHSPEYGIFKSVCDEFYHSLEEKLETKFYHPLNIIKLLTREEEIIAWAKKKDHLNSSSLIDAQLNNNAYSEYIHIECDGFETTGAYVDPEKYISESQKYFSKQNIYSESFFDYQSINSFDKNTYVIFCEGHQAVNNPFFNFLPFLNAKGELLTIHITDKSFPQKMINAGFFIMPIGNNTYKVGATYEWIDLTSNPTEQGKSELVLKLKSLIKSDFEISEHKAGVRPILKDQTPVLGPHPENGNIFVFNGLGSKGALYGPYLSNMLCDFLIDKKAIAEKFNVGRFV